MISLEKLKRIKSSQFLISLSVLMSGSVIAQIISILISPVITRLYTPSQFGIYTLVLTAISIFGPVICLKYDMGIVMAKTVRETYSLIKLSIFLSLPLSIIISVIYGLVFMSGNFQGLQLWGIIFTINVLLLGYGLNNILLAYNNKNRQYKLISSVTIVKTLINNVLLVISGFLKFGVIGLLGSQVISTFSGLWVQSRNVRANLTQLRKINIRDMKNVFINNSSFPLFNATSALVTTTVYSSINLFVAIVYSVQQLGFYSLSYRVLGIPFVIISANIARVFFDYASKDLVAKGNYSKIFNKTLLILVLTIVPIITFLGVWSPWLFSIVFGETWEVAGIYVRLLAPMFAIRLISESLTTSFIISGKQHIELIFQTVLFGGQIILYCISYVNNFPIEQFLLLISLLYMFVHVIMLYKMYILSKEVT